jgi:hypothetical protein
MLQQNHTTAKGKGHVEGHTVVYDRTTTGTLSSTTSTLCPSRAARLIARLRHCSLDRALIAGADPASSPQLAARAARLASTRERTLLAEGVERLLRAAQGAQRRWSAVSRREPLLANSAELHELASLLRSSRPLYVRGIAIVQRLLSDGTGPAYFGSAERLQCELRDARAAMRGYTA